MGNIIKINKNKIKEILGKDYAYYDPKKEKYFFDESYDGRRKFNKLCIFYHYVLKERPENLFSGVVPVIVGFL